jgi:hypothetical protein
MFVDAPVGRQWDRSIGTARVLTTEAPVPYHLLQPDGTLRESERPGTLGGNATLRIYGRLDCSRAIAALPLGYANHRVFFADEDAAIAAGFRPCGRCMNERYTIWKAGPLQNRHYPWRQTPHHPMGAPNSLA